MSEELEWELYDIFESGMFVFPIYEHNSARKIVRYLLFRGVIEEEIAEAIEDSTVDLHMWLNRQGKHMVGEWVIAWVNDHREEYDREKEREMRLHPLEHHPGTREPTPQSEIGPDDDDDDLCVRARYPQSQGVHANLDNGNSGIANTSSGESEEEVGSDVDELDFRRPLCGRPLPLPPRMLQPSDSGILGYGDMRKDSAADEIGDPIDTSSRKSMEYLYNTEDVYSHADPDSGTVSDLYSCIPPDRVLDSLDLVQLDNSGFLDDKEATIDQMGLPVCPNCTCTLSHYSYLHANDSCQNHHSYCDIYFAESVGPAMQYNFETLDQDGPGFIFILTDSFYNCLSWSTEHRYKIASSRQPDRCLVEFQARNIEVAIIWQVRVKRHLTAVKEVHTSLQKYNLHSNWFKCALSVVMEALSTVATKYKP